ncbi:hypothetical protein [Mesorhizobium sp. WSM3224]|uniref:hypothetical protein n=1 Tax=Mesorhizobium sp. WSM3224 TaxID=1040986 RepID=UPI0012EC55BC|nr:hypothetical protein [Mesorhizobium sp. WSM3224]
MHDAVEVADHRRDGAGEAGRSGDVEEYVETRGRTERDSLDMADAGLRDIVGAEFLGSQVQRAKAAHRFGKALGGS